MRHWSFILTAALSCSAFSQLMPMKFRVVDERGRGVAGAEVSNNWVHDSKGWRTYEGLRTDAQGRASGDFYVFDRGALAQAWDKERNRWGSVTVRPRDKGRELIITLRPAARFRLGLESLVEKRPPTSSSISLSSAERMPLGQIYPVPSGWIKVPPIPGVIRVTAKDHAGEKIQYDIKSGDSRDLGVVKLDHSSAKKLEGRPAPAIEFEDRVGIPSDFQLEDWKGSWIVLEFWGWWCGPCVTRGIPSAIGLHDAAVRSGSPVKVLGIHELEAATVAEVEGRLPEVKSKFWGGRDLPFPWVVDADQSIAKTFGVVSYPSTVLIDPEGRVVGNRYPHELSKDIKGLSPSARLEWLLVETVPMILEGGTIKTILDFDFWEFDIHVSESAQSRLDTLNQPFGTYNAFGSRGAILSFLLEDSGLKWAAKDGAVTIELGESTHWYGPFAESRHREYIKMMAARPELDFTGTLGELSRHLSQRVDPAPVFSPLDVSEGRINLDRKVKLKTSGGTLWDELTKVLEPLGLKLEIWHESVVIKSFRRPLRG